MNQVRSLHEFALEARIRLLMRTGKAQTPQDMWAMATGTAAAWAFHRALQRLAEVDPKGTGDFVAELIEELELPDFAEDAGDIAERMGFDPQAWIDAEYTQRGAAV